MDNEYMARGYLLPEGCKDLIDVVKKKGPAQPVKQVPSPAGGLPPIVGEKMVTGPMTVLEVAALLEEKPFRIIAELMDFNVFANIHQQLDFEIIAQLLRRYGFIAKKDSDKE